MPSPRPQERKPGPQFDLTVLESLEAWRRAIKRTINAERACKVAITPTEKSASAASRNNAYKALYDARVAFELMFRASVTAEAV